MINTNELLARLLGQTSPNEDIAKTIAAQTFPSGSFGRAQLAAPVGAPAPPPQAPAPAVPDLPAVQEVADRPLVGTEYAPPQPAPGPAPAAAPVARGPAPDFSPSFAQKMMNFGDNLNGRGSDLGEQSKSRSQTFAMLRDKWGLDDQTAEFATRNPAVLQSLFTAKFSGGQTDDLKEYAAAKAQGFEGSFVDFKKATQRTNAVTWKDLGTELVGFDSTGNEISRVPKDVAGTAAAKERGKALGEAQVDLPKVENIARRLKDQVSSVRTDPNLEKITGWGAKVPTFLPESVTSEEKAKQLSGGAFLQAFESLKGAGAITEVEGEKATSALARLSNLKQDTPGYRRALDDFEREVDALVDLARRKAAGGQSAPAGASAPDTLPAPSAAPGTVRKYNPATGALE
jgi:hypothetical protein